MVIKKFTAKTEADAVEAAKKELGEGLVVMNVRQVKAKGLFSFLKARQVEVTVALEEEKDMVRPVRKEAENRKILPEKTKGSAEVQNTIEQKLDSLQNFLENQIRKSEKEQEPSAEPSADRKDLQKEASETENKDEKKLSAEEEKKEAEQDKFIRLLYNTMIENEVAEKYANQIIADVEKTRTPNMPFDYILANIYQKVILKFGKSEGIVAAENGPRVVFFIGPTGVGKTTTIAKLASNLAMEEKKKVALLTADTYRIAAAEQLRTYAQILEVPFRVIYTREEFQGAVEDFKECDYILVDTAGHSHRNEEQMADMKEYLDSVDASRAQVFLVLSATTKYADLIRIAQSYKEITDYQLIFTKLDETGTVGNLLNVKLYADTPIAYTTYGQNVPNDIERFNPQRTVKQLLGGKA